MYSGCNYSIRCHKINRSTPTRSYKYYLNRKFTSGIWPLIHSCVGWMASHMMRPLLRAWNKRANFFTSSHHFWPELTLSKRKSGLIQSNSYCVPGASRVVATALQSHMIVTWSSFVDVVVCSNSPVIGLEVHEAQGNDGTRSGHMTVHMISFLEI